MDKDFCRQIDEEDLIEKYIAGKLHGELLNRLTEHLQECIDHSNAVNLEKALSRGVREFARSELKSNLRTQIKKHEISKYYILRYAAILVVAIMAPIVLYYQLISIPTEDPNIAEQKQPASTVVQTDESIAEQPEISSIKSTSAHKKTAGAQAPEVAEPSLSRETETRASKPVSSKNLSVFPSNTTNMKEIENFLKSHEYQISACIPESERTLLGRIRLEIGLNENGSIRDLIIEPEKQITEKSLKCIKELINQLDFPAPSETVVVEKYILLNSDLQH